MSGFALRQNMAFEWDGVPHIIERLTPQQQAIVRRETDGHTLICAFDELLSAYSEGQIAVPEHALAKKQVRSYSRPMADLPPHLQKETKRRLAYLEGLEEQGSYVLTPQSLAPIITQIAQQLGDPKPPSPSSVYRWLSRFRNAQDIRALIPRYDLRGTDALRQPDKLLELFSEAAQEAFASTPAATGGNVYDRLQMKVAQENRLRFNENRLVMPSRRTVYRMFRRIDAYDLTALKYGKNAADRRFRIFKNGPVVEHILQRVEVDHTPLDLFLIDDFYQLPLGRPTLTILIDVYSRFPIGHFISFGPPSVEAVVGALRHAILPKKPAKQVVQGVLVEHRWPCYGVMQELVCDNGLEFLGTTLEAIALDLGIGLQFCPKRQPRFKGVIERFLKTVNYYFTHQMPGTSLARFTERGDYDPQKHAVLTLGEFTHLFEKWLLDVYAQTVHRGIGTTPWAKWHDGLQRMTPQLPGTLEDLRTRIGKAEVRKLNQEGLFLMGIRYAGPELEPILRTWGSGTPIRVVYDPSDLGSILAWPPKAEHPLTITAADPEYAKGLTEFQHKTIRKMLREQGKKAANPQRLAEARHQLMQEVDALVQSRKLGKRKRAARLSGANSDQPEARMSAPKPKRQLKSQQPIANPESPLAPKLIPSFKLPSRKDWK
ncbi:DDE-type integrase/transposase/recombinase [Chromobacterium subtsugae]|uniref:DDE-type integrase/transposase/recombinase n=1 Tax=Chromobacterium subtsugae TaxID=251747 RepID=UPI000640D632|nr:DDE-type integrase/transposase/recombinase [Chromobacterium subtsugae]